VRGSARRVVGRAGRQRAAGPGPDWVRTFNYGGGARWFAKPHLAFHVDVRLHAIDPGPAQVCCPEVLVSIC